MPKEDNKFKLILLAVFGLLIVVGLVVFATYKSSSTTNSNVEVTIWGTIDSTTFNSFIQQYDQDYNASLRLQYTQKSIDTIDGDLVEAIATGKEPDVILVPQDLEERYLDKVYLMTSIPVRTIQDTFVPESDLYLQASGTFALPFAVDPLVMYWNKDLFGSAAIATPPATWAEFPSLADKLTKLDQSGNITQSAVALGEYGNIDNAKAIVSNLILQAGSQIVANDNGSLKSDLYSRSLTDVSVPAVSAMTFYTDYANPQKTVYSWNISLPSSKQSFLAENLAVYFGFASEYGDIKNKNPNLNFDVSMIPQVVGTKNKLTFGELYGFSLVKNSPNIVPAFQLISTLTSAQAEAEFSNVSDFAPARRDLISQGSKDPAKTVFFNSALISEGWLDPDMTKTDQIFKEMIQNITSGRLDVDSSVQNASGELDNLL